MRRLRYLLLYVLETCLRILPVASKPGLVRIGHPAADAPVFLTCNYHLTVEIVKRALRGENAYLLVAKSKGINVWCAATGGLMTNHDVVSVLKTSGIERMVNHRTVIMPQLAATGVESKVINQKTGWKLIWGPVYAKDIPEFLQRRFTKSREMTQVAFPWPQRFEMAVAWAFPISCVSALIAVLLLPEAFLPLTGLVWGLSITMFLAFPLYHRWLTHREKTLGFVLVDFGRWGFKLVLWGAGLAALTVYKLCFEDFTWKMLAVWAPLTFVIVLILSIDLTGSTPIYKSDLHEERRFKVVLDEAKCKGVGFCEQVCPRNCYEMDPVRRVASLPRVERCVQCGACIVQCPFEAIHFESPSGGILPPKTIRRYKLNLLGKRK